MIQPTLPSTEPKPRVMDSRTLLDLLRGHFIGPEELPGGVAAVAIETLTERTADLAEARREAERLRGEVQQRADDLAVLKPLAEDVDRRAKDLIRLRADAYTLAGYFANEQKAARTVGNDGIADVLAHVVDEIRALAGSSDTTAGREGSNDDV